MRIAEIFSLGRDGGYDGHGGYGGSKRHYRKGGYHKSYSGYRKGNHYDRHNGGGLLGILGGN